MVATSVNSHLTIPKKQLQVFVLFWNILLFSILSFPKLFLGSDNPAWLSLLLGTAASLSLLKTVTPIPTDKDLETHCNLLAKDKLVTLGIMAHPPPPPPRDHPSSLCVPIKLFSFPKILTNIQIVSYFLPTASGSWTTVTPSLSHSGANDLIFLR